MTDEQIRRAVSALQDEQIKRAISDLRAIRTWIFIVALIAVLDFLGGLWLAANGGL